MIKTGVWVSVFRNSFIHQISLNSWSHSRLSEHNGLPQSICDSFLWFFLRFLLTWFTTGCPVRSSTLVDTVTGEMSLSIRFSRSRVSLPLDVTVGDEVELEEDVEQWLSCLERVLEVDWSEPEDELADKPGTTIRTKFSVLHCVWIPFFVKCGFWPLIHSKNTRFHRKGFRAIILLACFEDFHSQEFSNSLTYTVASSCVSGGYDYHRTTRIRQKHLSSPFLLIICIDAPESTTNSRSSGLRLDASKHLFSEGEKNCCSFFFL